MFLTYVDEENIRFEIERSQTTSSSVLTIVNTIIVNIVTAWTTYYILQGAQQRERAKLIVKLFWVSKNNLLHDCFQFWWRKARAYLIRRQFQFQVLIYWLKYYGESEATL